MPKNDWIDDGIVGFYRQWRKEFLINEMFEIRATITKFVDSDYYYGKLLLKKRVKSFSGRYSSENTMSKELEFNKKLFRDFEKCQRTLEDQADIYTKRIRETCEK